MLGLGSCAGGELTVEHLGYINVVGKLVCLPARAAHGVRPSVGLRITLAP